MNENMLFEIENAWINYNAAVVSHAGKNAARERLANVLINNTPELIKLLKGEEKTPVTGDVPESVPKKKKKDTSDGIG